MALRRAARVDANQADIVAALRRCGISVEIVGQPLDLLICCRGVTSLGECKSKRPTNEGGSHGLTKGQVEFLERWPGKVFHFTSPEQAVAEVLGKEFMA